MICSLCPRHCRAERTADSGAGFCGMGTDPVLARAALHFDEEPVISGTGGSGAVFFSGCVLKCRFCQNFELSHHNFGKRITEDRLREIYYELIAQGAHNINLVNATHFLPAVLHTAKDLPVPVVWNSGGYETAETVRALDGTVSVFLPDLKYVSPVLSGRYSAAEDYINYALPAIKQMLKQVGPVRINDDGLITSGVIIRHLILPGCAEDSKKVLDIIARELKGAWVSLMAQYLPFGEVSGCDQLHRRLTEEEYESVCDHMMDLGLEDGFVQELSSSDETYIPKFDLTGV